MPRIPFAELQPRIERILLHLGLAPERAALSARLTAETDLDGVKTHGIARLPRFAEMVRLGRIDPAAAPTCVAQFGALERWTGHRGPGNLAAHTCMDRALTLATQHGIGAVALADSSHWMRAGTYGFQAANAGFAALCFTNTLPNLPPWGAKSPALGNNPLVIALPYLALSGQPAPIVLDIAMSQFSYGSLSAYASKSQPLPVPGGYDAEGHLTTDAAAIERSQRALPIGFWKGSGLSFVLNVLAAMLSGGLATHNFNSNPLAEVGQSQVFLAIAPTSLATMAELSTIASGAINALHAAEPIDPTNPIRYPGEGALRLREENLRLGVPVDDSTWQSFLTLEASTK
jgi:3-dehydro-L-gulonate 2-dehydrogenase